MCRDCGTVIETLTVKKDNLRLFSDEEIWCPKCEANKPEIRDIAGRQESIAKEQQSYPESPTSGPPRLVHQE
jgi:hypothetical protein